MTWRRDEGQMTILMLGLVAVTLLMVVLVAAVGSAMVHRARARTAADAVALASAIDADVARDLSDWYGRNGVQVQWESGAAHASSGRAQAAAWAGAAGAAVDVAPALVAIVARAEQILGAQLEPTQWRGTIAIFGAVDGATITVVAAELGLCPIQASELAAGEVAFELC